MAYSWADCDRSWVNMEGAQTAIGDGVGPPLSVGCDQSWASLGPPLLKPFIIHSKYFPDSDGLKAHV